MGKKKKLALILSVSSVLLVVAVLIGIGWFINMTLEVIPTDSKPYSNEVDLKEEYPEAWEELGESLKILEYGELDFYAGDNGTFVFSDEFIKVFHKIYNGYYANTSDEQIHVILLDKIDRMTTLTLNAGEVYEKLKPTDGVTIETYLAEIDSKIVESKTDSAQQGYGIGDKVNFNFSGNKKELTYQGGDKWIDSDGIIYIASKTDDGLYVERETSQVADNTQNNNSSSSNKNKSSSSSSKYISEQNGYKVGSVVENNGMKYTYTGKDIWQDTNGETYKAMYNKDGSIEICPKSPFGVGALTDDDGYMLPDTGDSDDYVDTREELAKLDKNGDGVIDHTEDPRLPEGWVDTTLQVRDDPSGYAVGTAGWHKYWDGKTVKEYYEQGGVQGLYYITKEAEGNTLPTTEDYPYDYVIGSYAVLIYDFYGEGQHLYGAY